MSSKKGFGIIEIVIIGLAVLFVLSIFVSFRGWGYPGYGGFYHGPSWMYWGAPQTYHSCDSSMYNTRERDECIRGGGGYSSIRSGSINGTRFSGSGLHGGK